MWGTFMIIIFTFFTECTMIKKNKTTGTSHVTDPIMYIKMYYVTSIAVIYSFSYLCKFDKWSIACHKNQVSI